MPSEFNQRLQMLKTKHLAVGVVALGLIGAVWFGFAHFGGTPARSSDLSSQSRKGSDRYTPTPAEWASLTIQPVAEHDFRAEHITEGKIAVDEDRSTPVFSPYTGRVTQLMVKPGDQVAKGQPLFVIEASDTVQAQNDFITAMTGLNKAKSALDLAQLQDTRAKDLFEGKAVPLKDYQQSQATLIQAQNDMRSSQTALEAARNKLQILGFDDAAIANFQEKGRLDPATTVFSPIAGTVVQRKAGPGQFINSGASDPVYRDRRSLHGLADRVRPRNRCGDRVGRTADFLQRAGAARRIPSRRASIMSRRRSTPTHGGCWFAPPSTTRTAC